MARKFKITANTNAEGVDLKKMYELQNRLQSAYNYLTDLDDKTYEACDGDALMNDLDTYVRQLATSRLKQMEIL